MRLTERMIETFGPIAIGAVVFVAAAKLFKINELEKAFGAIRRKFAR